MPPVRFLKLLVSGLHKIPPSALTLYRGVAKSLSQLPQKFEKGKSVVWWAVTSTASHVSVLENPQFMGKSGARCLFTVSAVCARDIQRYSAMGSSEREYVLPPGTCLVVQDILDAGAGLTIVQLAEDSTMKLLKFEHPASASASASSVPTAPAPAVASAASPAPAPAALQVEDPDIVALSQSLKDIGIGTAASCLKFAKALEEQGVLSLERLKKLPVDKAQKVLEKVKMTDIQIDAVMEAIAPPPAAAAVSPAPSPAPAPAPAPAALLPPKSAPAAPAQVLLSALTHRFPTRALHRSPRACTFCSPQP